MENLNAIRNDYKLASLNIEDCMENPIDQLQLWLQDAVKAQDPEPTAMCLSTIGRDGNPNSRIVLLKEILNDELVFFTNYQSQKAEELDHHPFGALNMLWKLLERQVRIKGKVSKVPHHISEKYFQSRPKESQISAWASPQSRHILDKAHLEHKWSEIADLYKDTSVLPLPDFWGGFALRPQSFEFWQGRPNRFHDRIFYSFDDQTWKKSRLAP